MAMKLDFSRFKNACLVRTNLLMPIVKALFLFAIWQGLKPLITLNDFWIVPIWIVLGFVLDGLIIFKKPKIFEGINLGEEEQAAYGMSSEEFEKYLKFSPRIRLARTFISIVFTLTICFFFELPDWSLALMVGLFLGFVILDPILLHLLHIEAPLVYKRSDYNPSKALDEIHTNDPFWPGSGAWTALRSTRQFDNYPNL